MKNLTLLLFFVIGLAVVTYGFTQISAAFSSTAAVETFLPTHTPQPPAVQAALPTQTSQPSSPQDLTRIDNQGAIIIEITPQNMSTPGSTINFEISMNTHSVDLNMDLAILATLTMNDGRAVQATLWDAPRGGHHVEGNLTFPAILDGKALLDGATTLTLTIKDMDAPERVFNWDLKN